MGVEREMAQIGISTSIEEPQGGLHFGWVFPFILKPRQWIERVVHETERTWLTPLLILSISAILLVLAGAPLAKLAAKSGTELPADFQYYTPEQQAQFQQALEASSGPVFVYVFPLLGALGRVWVGWLAFGYGLHLLLTLLGGRSSSLGALNLVAWSALPFAFRDAVRIVYILLVERTVTQPGLSGFFSAGNGSSGLFLSGLAQHIDLYLIAFLVYLIIGVRMKAWLAPGKALASILVMQVLALILQTLPAFLVAQISGLNVVRPFFF